MLTFINGTVMNAEKKLMNSFALRLSFADGTQLMTAGDRGDHASGTAMLRHANVT